MSSSPCSSDSSHSSDSEEIPPFLFRAFHTSSSGTNSRNGFTANLSRGLDQDNPLEVASALRDHFNINNRNPTYWISATDDFLRAINIACDWAYNDFSGVSIAVIKTDACQNCELESAEELSTQYRLGDGVPPIVRRTEWLFLYRIPKAAIVACLSLRVLISRGLYRVVPDFNPRHSYWDRNGGDVSLEDMREAVGNTRSRTGGRGYWTNVGIRAAEMAMLFGNGAHTKYLADEAVLWWEEVDDYRGRYIEEGIDHKLETELNNVPCFG